MTEQNPLTCAEIKARIARYFNTPEGEDDLPDYPHDANEMFACMAHFSKKGWHFRMRSDINDDEVVWTCAAHKADGDTEFVSADTLASHAQAGVVYGVINWMSEFEVDDDPVSGG